MRFRAQATFERNSGSSPLASMHCLGLATSKVVLLKFSGDRVHTSGEEYTVTLCDASLKPLNRREASCWSPVVGGRTNASVSICMPHLRYQASSFNAIRCYLAMQSVTRPMTARIRTILESQSDSGRLVMNELLNAGLGGR
jgi:hypothetical protein